MKGSLVVDEIPCRIVDVYFEKGKLWLVCVAESPPDHREGFTDMRLYGRDGVECGTVRTWVPKWEGITGTLTLLQDVIFSEMVGQKEKHK